MGPRPSNPSRNAWLVANQEVNPALIGNGTTRYAAAL